MKKQLLISMIFILSSSFVQAGFFNTNAPVVEKQRTVEEDRENTAGMKKSHRTVSHKKSVIKCWQYGRLLFEEENWRKGNFNKTNNKVFNGMTNYGKPFSLIGMGETFCYIRE